MSTIAALDAVVARLDAVAAKAEKTVEVTEAMAQRVRQSLDQQHEALDRGLRMFQEFSDSGNEWSQRFLGLVQQVEEGNATALSAIMAFGDAVVDVEGKARSFRDVASSLGLQQLTTDLRDLIKEAKTWEEQVAILGKLQGEQAKEIRRLIDAMERGEPVVDELLQKLAEAKRAQGALGQLADPLYDELSKRNRGGGI